MFPQRILSQENHQPDHVTKDAQLAIRYYKATVKAYKAEYGPHVTDDDLRICAQLVSGLLAMPTD